MSTMSMSMFTCLGMNMCNVSICVCVCDMYRSLYMSVCISIEIRIYDEVISNNADTLTWILGFR